MADNCSWLFDLARDVTSVMTLARSYSQLQLLPMYDAHQNIHMLIIITLMAWGVLRLHNPSWYANTQIGVSKHSFLVLEEQYRQDEHTGEKGTAYLVLDLPEDEREVGGQVTNGYPTQSLRGNCLDIFR